MTFDEFEKRLVLNPHTLSDEIREGKIPFSDLIKYVKKAKSPPLVMFAYLIHPDCTVEEFKKYYHSLTKQLSDITKGNIFLNSRVFKEIEAIAYVLDADSSTLENIKKTYEYKPEIFKKLAKNPFINGDFKSLYYEVSGDINALPSLAKDIFIF